MILHCGQDNKQDCQFKLLPQMRWLSQCDQCWLYVPGRGGARFLGRSGLGGGAFTDGSDWVCRNPCNNLTTKWAQCWYTCMSMYMVRICRTKVKNWFELSPVLILIITWPYSSSRLVRLVSQSPLTEYLLLRLSEGWSSRGTVSQCWAARALDFCFTRNILIKSMWIS